MYHVLLSLEESVESVQALGIDLSVPDMGQLGDNYAAQAVSRWLRCEGCQIRFIPGRGTSSDEDSYRRVSCE